jgi:hypothetical protein
MGVNWGVLRQQVPELNRLRGEVERLTGEVHLVAGEREKIEPSWPDCVGPCRSRKSKPTPSGPKLKTATLVKSPFATRSPPASEALVRREDWKNVGLQTPLIDRANVNGQKRTGAQTTSQFARWADNSSRAGVEAIFAAAPNPCEPNMGRLTLTC